MAGLDVHRYQHDIPENLSDFNPKPFVNGVLGWVDGLVKQNEDVALSASGGVDSTTVAFLLKEVLGKRLHLYFINDGFRRIIGGREEYEVTADMFKDFPDFEVIQTADRVLPWFDGEADGTLKRDMFRHLYTLTSNRHLAHLGANWIVDGTIAPDIAMTAQKRQIQHNVDLPYSARKLEPLASLYKPHVRQVAMHLGLPRDFAMRIPCPGPAQLLRVGGEFNPEKLRIAKNATDIVEQMVEKYCTEQWGEPFKYDEKTGVRTPFQYLATCLDYDMEMDAALTNSVRDFLGGTAECYRMKTEAIWIDTSVAEQENRLYAPIVWIRGPKLNPDKMTELYNKMYNSRNIPRILYEVFNSGEDGYPAGIRAVESEDVTIAWPMKIDFDYLSAMGERICNETSASMVGYDISRRPPGTVELF